ncbi:hypothetical protein N7481_001025 [Penicillium waksmanii]|uniref:uncharacterized protein n=1 Tax=Penicillium waksmanii TaxID=69791 RepID=UPI0025497CE3|nr:uncharacterized protein N7481_001025 [Penicillium waksmanii]KAJ6000616.1 hypothetical protein N7481_001025 [Penicillium waksmanii]
MDYVTRGVCGQEGCREKRYYLDNGLWFCRRGHLQEGVQVEADPDDFGTQGKTHRVRKEKAETSRKTYRGRWASTLYLQAYQLILWKQCHVLVKDHGFPEQFEGVVRDLWALRLRGFSMRINETTDDDDDEPQIFSSQTTPAESENESADESGFRPETHILQWPRLLDSVGLCYLAAVLMRLPVCVVDLHRYVPYSLGTHFEVVLGLQENFSLIIRQDIPYIRAMRSIPQEMGEKLPPEFVARLEINNMPKPERMHRGFIELGAFYSRRFGITLPRLNAPLLLYRHIKRMAVPIDVYETAKTLQGILGITFEYPTRIRGNGRKEALNLPEVQTIVLIILATKLLFPFDDLERNPATSKEPATQTVNWQRWMQAQRQFSNHEQAGGQIGKEQLMRITDHDALGMNFSEIDQYLDWYEKDWLHNVKTSNPIAEMFPTSRSNARDQSNTIAGPVPTVGTDTDEALSALLQAVLADLKPASMDPSSKALRPGSWYARYRWESQLPETARAFYELGAQLASITLTTLVRAVSVAEWRVARFLLNQRRDKYMMEWAMKEEENDVDNLDEQFSDLEV